MDGVVERLDRKLTHAAIDFTKLFDGLMILQMTPMLPINSTTILGIFAPNAMVVPGPLCTILKVISLTSEIIDLTTATLMGALFLVILKLILASKQSCNLLQTHCQFIIGNGL